MTLLIEEQGGVIDKYIGDAIMAIFTYCGNSTGNSNNGSGIGSSNSSGSANSNNNSNNSMVVSDSGNVGNVSGNKANNVKFANSTAGGGSSNDNLTQNNSSATNNNNNCSTVTITTTNNNNNSINNNNTSNNNGSINNCCEARACHAILKCIKQLERKQLEWNNRGLPSIKCRIGVHSGKALVGNFGSSKRLNFTAIGHNVNLAARLEPLCKLYETNNLISDITYNYVKDKFCCKFIDIVVVKGTSGTVVVYTLLEERESASVSQLEIEKISFELRDCLIDNQLKDATNKISEALKLEGYNSKDRSLQIIRERCERFYENEKGFTGVLTLTEKSF
ncbi:hypothetical protein ABK040_009686 [Willaertia magna]